MRLSAPSFFSSNNLSSMSSASQGWAEFFSTLFDAEIIAWVEFKHCWMGFPVQVNSMHSFDFLLWIWCSTLVYPACVSHSNDIWLEGCVLTASRRNIEVFGSTCFWSQLSYPSSCNWDRTLAARPREILRSINKLQTQLNKGGLAGFEVSRLCKSMSSCFVLIPRKASISMSSPVVAWIVRWAVLVICQRLSFPCSGTSCLQFANLVSLPNQLLHSCRFSTESLQLPSLCLATLLGSSWQAFLLVDALLPTGPQVFPGS